MSLLRRANPVPHDPPAPSGPLADEILAGPSPPRRTPGPITALAAAALVLVVAGLGVVAARLLSGDPRPATTISPPVVTTTTLPGTTVPADTTLPEQRPEPPQVAVVLVPNMVGMLDIDAFALLEDLQAEGFEWEMVRVVVDDPGQHNRVIATMPPGGVEVAEGTRLVVTVGVAAARAMGTAPWSAPPLPANAVPAVLGVAWSEARVSGYCSALTPAKLDQAAVARRADYADGWAVAWDLAAGPGMLPDGTFCADCGRSAFGVAGTASVPKGTEAQRWPNLVTWDDGSAAGYGNMGDFGDEFFVDGETGELIEPMQLAYLVVAGQACVYDVWSFLGPEHLVSLLEELRFVEGMQSPPVQLYEPGVRETVDLDSAPWTLGPVVPEPGDLAVLGDGWSRALAETGWNPEVCPALTFADTGRGNAEEPGFGTSVARIRAARGDPWVFAWDMPDGPGRHGSGDYCAGCGRGAFGIAAADPFRSALPDPPYRYEWDDGSMATAGYEVFGDDLLPEDRITHLDPESGARVLPPLQARVVPIGFDCEYRVWTFLGRDHLEFLLDHLRIVEAW